LRNSIVWLLALTAGSAYAQIGQNFPAHMRPEGDPAVVERGKALYGTLCRACHGADLRGGDVGGPNLLRSELVLNDQAGELIAPVILEGRVPVGGGTAMPPQPQLAEADRKAIAEYIHSVSRTTVAQGGPPRGETPQLNLLVGNARAGQQYFNKECASCHSATGDMAGIGARVTDIGRLQDSWVGGRRSVPPGTGSRSTVRVTVTLADGRKQSGELSRIDDFTVSFTDDEGVYHSYLRRSGSPRLASVVVDDPLAGHRALWTKLTDKDMHDVTAYLASLK
jgi:cytochrome c oxidase cbb3-type subunit 3